MIHPNGGLPHIEHRTRDTAVLMSAVEWGWSVNPDEAYVFPLHGLPAVAGPDDFARSAEFHVAKLKDQGETNFVYVCVHGERARQDRELRRLDRAAGLDATVRDEEPTRATEPPEAPARRGIGSRYRGARRGRVSPEDAYKMTAEYLGEGGGD